MNAYTSLKFMIKYKRKSNETILEYMNAYLKNGDINQEQYDLLLGMM